ncbi:hypothetical protein EBS80_02235 [bacterium]|nr:hypothetical protein [bacterium]
MFLYSVTNLPLFVENSAGIALPKVGPDVAACIAPAAATIARPASWGEGQALDIAEGTWHIAQDAVGDSYPNQEFATFYETGEELDGSDERAAFLKAYWAERGFADVKVVLARKTRAANVIGQVATEAAGSKFVNHEGETEIGSGGYVLQSPDDSSVMWYITEKVFGKKYQGVTPNNNSSQRSPDQ